ncbi:uncharacterized protein LOC128675240 [Plodia interpunctella]|uniref:uncharacterized protein LOC128675240 n=1 Tax=Plodia interpunctella TaxID=58824 RepID=UPI0023680C6C|nr:uncharacterized protein LOC128675240 [Plodia interpunctella]
MIKAFGRDTRMKCYYWKSEMFVYIFSAAVLLPYVAPESCYFKQCLGCRPEDIFSPGTPIECHPSNWATPEWIYNHGHPPPSTASRVPIEYRCLKFVATPDDKTFGNTVDILKGCVPKQQADSVCVGLESVERARGHSDARCYICNRNNCNSARHVHVTITVPLISVTLYYVFR